MGGACSTHEAEIHRKFQSKKLDGRDDAKDLDVDGKVILERILQKQGGMLWTGFIWLRTGPSGGLVNTVMKLRVP
jgi:hypothetical protein